MLFFPKLLSSSKKVSSSKMLFPDTNYHSGITVFGIPAYIRIPVIELNASIESLGLTDKGEMASPKGPDNVSWFNLGPRPGQTGSAVIAGHYGYWKIGQGSVFDKIHTLNKSDKIYIEDGSGVITIFSVQRKEEYTPAMDASGVFYSTDNKAHLNLVTCYGDWNTDSKSYSKRLVIFADKD